MKTIQMLDSPVSYICGPRTVVTNYTRCLNARGVDTEIFVPSLGRRRDAKEPKFENYSIQYVKSYGFYGYRDVVGMWDSKMKKYLRASDASLFHAHSPFGMNTFANAIGHEIGVPTFLTFHTKFKEDFWRVTHSRALCRWMTKRMMAAIADTDYLLTVSEGAKKVMREYGVPEERDIKVIRNGTDMVLPDDPQAAAQKVRANYNLSPNEKILLFVGRVVDTKNIELALDALAISKARGLQFKFFIVGDGEHKHTLMKKADHLKISDRVIFTGQIDDRDYLKGFYLAANLFLLPSVYDTASLVPLEAATFSLPTLMIKDSCTSEIIEDGVSGYCEKADPQLWSDCIEKALISETANAVRERCRKDVYRPWQDVVDEVVAYYEVCIEDYKRKHPKKDT